jgi:hypothetical protein
MSCCTGAELSCCEMKVEGGTPRACGCLCWQGLLAAQAESITSQL